MTRILDRIIILVNWISIAAASLYVYSMFLHPWFKGGWENVHTVWFQWQSLNVGVLAFAASLIAFNISKYHSDQQRRREFIAARSFLPESLSELVAYFKSSAHLLAAAYTFAERQAWPNGVAPALTKPDLVGNYREVFSRCIAHAEPEHAEYLSRILVRLQVHHARLTELLDDLLVPDRRVVTQRNVVSYIYRLGELQALVDKIFPIARGEREFPSKELGWEEFRNSYGILDFDVEALGDLEEFTRRALARNHGVI